MGRLRDKMIGDLKLRGLSENTRETYLHCVTVFARHHGMSPAKLGREQVRDFLLHLVEQRKVKAQAKWIAGRLERVHDALLPHPHVHGVLTGGALSHVGERWLSARGDYLFPVEVIGKPLSGQDARCAAPRTKER